MRHSYFFFFLLVLLFSISLVTQVTLVSAEWQIDIGEDYEVDNWGVQIVPEEAPINYSLIPTINSSEYWDGLNTPADILTSLLNNDAGFISTPSPWNRSGTDVFLANTNDEVGIGDTTPQNPLEVVGGVLIRSAVGEGNNAPENGLWVEEEVYIGGVGVANDELCMYEPAPNNYVTMRMFSADNGGGSTNGFMIRGGVSLTNNTEIWNYENGSLVFGTFNQNVFNITRDREAIFSGMVQADDYYSGDGTQGYTGTCTSDTDIVVKDGLIVSCA